MSLNVNTMSEGGGGDFGHPTLGGHVARFVGIVDMGIQDRLAFAGEAKSPCRKLNLTFELTDDFVEIDGVMKPRWISKSYNAFTGQNANLTAVVKALDPTGAYGGDLAAMARAGVPCLVQVDQKTDKNGAVVEGGVKIGQIGSLPAGIPVPALVNTPVVFDLSEPDINVFMGLQEWLRNQIMKAHDYASSPLVGLVANYQPPTQSGQQAAAQAATVNSASAAVVGVTTTTPVAQQISQPAPAPVAVPAQVQLAQQVQQAQPPIPPAPPGFAYDSKTNSYVPVATVAQPTVAQPSSVQVGANTPPPPAGGLPY